MHFNDFTILPVGKSSKRSSGPKEPTTNLKPGTVADDEDYEYEYDDEEIK